MSPGRRGSPPHRRLWSLLLPGWRPPSYRGPGSRAAPPRGSLSLRRRGPAATGGAVTLGGRGPAGVLPAVAGRTAGGGALPDWGATAAPATCPVGLVRDY